MNWFARKRHQWIEEMLNIYGFINREHLQKKFDISPQAASKDLASFIELRPGVMHYDVKKKRYVAAIALAEGGGE